MAPARCLRPRLGILVLHYVAAFETRPLPDVKSNKYVLTDLQGAQGETVLDHIIETPARRNYLITPLHAMNEFPDEQRECLELKEHIFPHLDLDHIDEAMALGWKDGMTLGVFAADRGCLRPERVLVQEDLDVELD